ncbi:hypothetical protein V6N13_015522 [Hibiscus sabdariffa]
MHSSKTYALSRFLPYTCRVMKAVSLFYQPSGLCSSSKIPTFSFTLWGLLPRSKSHLIRPLRNPFDWKHRSSLLGLSRIGGRVYN